ncbi:hypothetical protein HDU76_003768, partial [Blyttiomyces sp. JEL0837]
MQSHSIPLPTPPRDEENGDYTAFATTVSSNKQYSPLSFKTQIKIPVLFVLLARFTTPTSATIYLSSTQQTIRNYDFPGIDKTYNITSQIDLAGFLLPAATNTTTTSSNQHIPQCLMYPKLIHTNSTATSRILFINALEAIQSGCHLYEDIPGSNNWYNNMDEYSSKSPFGACDESKYPNLINDNVTKGLCNLFNESRGNGKSDLWYDIAIITIAKPSEYCCKDEGMGRLTSQWSLTEYGRFQNSQRVGVITGFGAGVGGDSERIDAVALLVAVKGGEMVTITSDKMTLLLKSQTVKNYAITRVVIAILIIIFEIATTVIGTIRNRHSITNSASSRPMTPTPTGNEQDNRNSFKWNLRTGVLWSSAVMAVVLVIQATGYGLYSTTLLRRAKKAFTNSHQTKPKQTHVSPTSPSPAPSQCEIELSPYNSGKSTPAPSEIGSKEREAKKLLMSMYFKLSVLALSVMFAWTGLAVDLIILNYGVGFASSEGFWLVTAGEDFLFVIVATFTALNLRFNGIQKQDQNQHHQHHHKQTYRPNTPQSHLHLTSATPTPQHPYSTTPSPSIRSPTLALEKPISTSPFLEPSSPILLSNQNVKTHSMPTFTYTPIQSQVHLNTTTTTRDSPVPTLPILKSPSPIPPLFIHGSTPTPTPTPQPQYSSLQRGTANYLPRHSPSPLQPSPIHAHLHLQHTTKLPIPFPSTEVYTEGSLARQVVVSPGWDSAGISTAIIQNDTTTTTTTTINHIGGGGVGGAYAYHPHYQNQDLVVPLPGRVNSPSPSGLEVGGANTSTVTYSPRKSSAVASRARNESGSSGYSMSGRENIIPVVSSHAVSKIPMTTATSVGFNQYNGNNGNGTGTGNRDGEKGLIQQPAKLPSSSSGGGNNRSRSRSTSPGVEKGRSRTTTPPPPPPGEIDELRPPSRMPPPPPVLR